jgi:hypothetical protein
MVYGCASGDYTGAVLFGQTSMIPVFRSAKRNGTGWYLELTGKGCRIYQIQIGRFEHVRCVELSQTISIYSLA